MRGLTIDELAARVGMTVRNVRAHQSRGLLPPPEVRGRTGYYGSTHVARLELIKDLQADGFNLRAIRHALDQIPPGAEGEMLAFRRAALDRWQDDPSEIVDLAGLEAALGTAEPELIAEAVRLGILRPLDNARFEVPAPALLRAGAELVALGVPVRALLDVQRALNEHAEAVAHVYVDLFLDHIWHPFVAEGQPEEKWQAVREALDRTQPLASQALVTTLRMVMQRAVEHAVGQHLDDSESSAG